MEYPIIAQKSPYKFDASEGTKKMWCTCGASENQPFCDGSHGKKETGMKPMKCVFEEAKTYYLCGCKQTKNPPYCDGSHSKI